MLLTRVFKKTGKYFLMLGLVLSLSACKVPLHQGLAEEEANQMLSLLLLNKIEADKQISKSGGIDLIVEKSQFVEAVEVLRQYGLPRIKVNSMQDIFPSGSLVSSPFEEQAKIAYLKEQQIQKMLSSLNGVVEAQVSVVQDLSQNKKENVAPSASVYIKYSSQENFLDREASVRNLVLRAVPNLRPESISVVLEEANLRYASAKRRLPTESGNGLFAKNPALIGALILLVLTAIVGLLGLRYKKGIYFQKLQSPFKKYTAKYFKKSSK